MLVRIAIMSLIELTALCCFAHAQNISSPSYSFDPSQPPRWKDFRGAVLSMDDTALSESYGAVTWTKHDGLPGGDVVNTFVYTLSRRRHWAIAIPPTHYAEDTIHTSTIAKGFTKTQATSFSRNLETSYGLQISVFQLASKIALK
jgi:hypothetical protein